MLAPQPRQLLGAARVVAGRPGQLATPTPRQGQSPNRSRPRPPGLLEQRARGARRAFLLRELVDHYARTLSPTPARTVTTSLASSRSSCRWAISKTLRPRARNSDTARSTTASFSSSE